jgi:glyoxylase-like metal-dependent hydrolase (beta-lactamase superfamily II)
VSQIRCIIADNPSAMTLDGTRTYVVGNKRVAVIDPGPSLDTHLDAVADIVGDGVAVSVVVTHSHPDHAEGASALTKRLGGQITELRDGLPVPTDAGNLRALATPGHTPDHFAFHFPAENAVFCGDLMMGGLDTALVALPEGNLQQYLQSLEKLRALRPTVIYPAHGEPFYDADAAIDAYVRHREERLVQVIRALKGRSMTAEALIDDIYGTALEPALRNYAGSAIEAYLAFLAGSGRAEMSADGTWSLK